MRFCRLLTGLVVFGLVGIASQTMAHHSYSTFDRAKTLELTGVIAELEWANPHVYIVVMARKRKGERPVRWMIEGHPPVAMARQGWKKSSAKVGDPITITINPLKTGEPGGHYVTAQLPGGVRAGLPGKH